MAAAMVDVARGTAPPLLIRQRFGLIGLLGALAQTRTP
jgi:hypothetical protein